MTAAVFGQTVALGGRALCEWVGNGGCTATWEGYYWGTDFYLESDDNVTGTFQCICDMNRWNGNFLYFNPKDNRGNATIQAANGLGFIERTDSNKYNVVINLGQTSATFVVTTN